MNAAALRAWFEKLAPRERWLVMVAAVLAAFALVFALGIRPLLVARSQAASRLESQRALLAEIENLARTRGPQVASAAPATPGGQSLVVLADKSTRERGLGAYLKRNQPELQGSLRLRFENAPFDLLLEWLADVQTRYGLTATTASFDPAGERGRVNCNIVLAPAAR